MRKHCKVVKVFEIPTDGKRLAWYSLLFFNLFTSAPYSVWRFHSKEIVGAIKNHVKEHSFDLVEIGTIALTNYAQLTPELPSLLVHHNIESELLLRRSKSLRNPFARAYLAYQGRKLRWFEKRACTLIDGHTTVSDRDGDTLRAIHPQVRTQTVPNGVDTDYFSPAHNQIKSNSLIFVGGMTWYPNLDAIIYLTRDIWHLIKAEVPDLSMTLIGRQPSKEIREFCRQDSSFRAEGFVDDVRPYISKAAVYVVPIRVGGGTRLKILDAMAMGKAIVSTSIGCEGIDVTDGKDIIIADHPEEIARRTVELLKDRSTRERIGQQARETAVEHYSWKKIYPSLEKAYNAVAGIRK